MIARHVLRARNSLGQNFLLDLNLTARIARAAGAGPDMTALEIGPGPGGLTRALLDRGAAVIAVETDVRCLAALEEVGAAHPGRLTLIHADALAVDLPALAPPPRRIVANLPYNVATPLLLRWLGETGAYESLTLMFQKEVADRLAAGPGGKAYGRLSVLVQWLCEVRREFNVDRAAFTPPPRIMSSVVTLTPRPRPLAPARRGALEKVTQAAFGQRRKMLRASLRPLGLDPDALGIVPTLRAEDLPVEDFCALARALDDA